MSVVRSLPRILVIAAVLTGATPSFAVFLSAAQWLRLSEQEQELYVAGVYDAMVTLVTNTVEEAASIHFQTCAARARLTPESITASLKTELADEPKLMGEPMPAAFIKYIVKLCGKPELK